jgi:hypothetical protein
MTRDRWEDFAQEIGEQYAYLREIAEARGDA